MVLIITITLIQDSTFRTVTESKIPVVLIDNDKGEISKSVIENLNKSGQFEIVSSLDGKNFNPALYPMRQIDTKHLSRWIMRTTGINHSFKLTGTFDIVSIQGMVTLGGHR